MVGASELLRSPPPAREVTPWAAALHSAACGGMEGDSNVLTGPWCERRRLIAPPVCWRARFALRRTAVGERALCGRPHQAWTKECNLMSKGKGRKQAGVLIVIGIVLYALALILFEVRKRK